MQKTIKTSRPRPFREKTDFGMVVSWLIDWVCSKCYGTDKLIYWLIAWLVLLIKINSKLWIDWLIEWLGALCLIDRLIDWLLYSTHVHGDTFLLRIVLFRFFIDRSLSDGLTCVDSALKGCSPLIEKDIIKKVRIFMRSFRQIDLCTQPSYREGIFLFSKLFSKSNLFGNIFK